MVSCKSPFFCHGVLFGGFFSLQNAIRRESEATAVLTELDKKILAALTHDGRASWVSLARRFSVSRATIQNRVEAMQVRNIIRGYTVIADPDSARTAAAFGETAFFLAQFGSGSSVFQLQKLLSDSPCVLGIWGVTGKWDCVALIRAASLRQMAELREHIVNKINIRRLETYPVLNNFAPLFQGGEPRASGA